MIVDVHSHNPTHEHDVPAEDVITNSLIGTGVKLAGSLGEYLAAMEPVDKALIFGIAPRPGGDKHPLTDWNAGWDDDLNHNDIAARVAAVNPNKFIPFMSLHPDQPDIDKEYDRAVGELGCRGIKLALSYQAVDPLSDAAFRLFDRLQSDGLPIVFHNGMSASPDAVLRYAHPLAMDEVAIAFPRLKMVLAHTSHPWYEDCMAVVRKHPNVYTDISGMPSRPWMAWRAMRVFHEFSATHKMLFGSDWTLWTPQETMDGLRAIPRFAKEHNLPPIPEHEIEAIINRDSLSLLGLE
ncbi:MAG: amidohydrolase family protein [Chloroflexi bacterium]|nr:amidohydrolase family protein [Chloroflexota bacterium]